MYGLVHRAVQCFAQDTYGVQFWGRAADKARLPSHDYESMLTYPDAQLDAVIDAMAQALEKTPAQICEDIGTYLVTHTRMNAVRRLLRFGGASYLDFVMSLDELHDRVRLALPELDLPPLEVRPHTNNRLAVLVGGDRPHFGSVLLGLMRAMADDYGALAMLELRPANRDDRRMELIEVELFDATFASGRDFDLVAEQVSP